MTANHPRATPARTHNDDAGSSGDGRLDDLLLAVAEGDERAFSELYDQLASRVFARIRRLLVDPSQSEEVMQEVFLEVWQAAPRFEKSKAGAVTWVLTLARQRAIDRIRSEQATRDRHDRVGARDYRPDYDDVAQTVESRVDGDRVRAALQQLPAPQREAITLSYYDGHSQSEVARMLGVPIGTIKTRQRNAMNRMRGELALA